MSNVEKMIEQFEGIKEDLFSKFPDKEKLEDFKCALDDEFNQMMDEEMNKGFGRMNRTPHEKLLMMQDKDADDLSVTSRPRPNRSRSSSRCTIT